jgi:hypothetical protein
MKFTVLQDLIQTYKDAIVKQSDSSDLLLLLRDTLRQLAEDVNDTYMDLPQPYTGACSSCGVCFTYDMSSREDRHPDTCVECWEKIMPGRSVFRLAKYAYKVL